MLSIFLFLGMTCCCLRIPLLLTSHCVLCLSHCQTKCETMTYLSSTNLFTLFLFVRQLWHLQVHFPNPAGCVEPTLDMEPYLWSECAPRAMLMKLRRLTWWKWIKNYNNDAWRLGELSYLQRLQVVEPTRCPLMPKIIMANNICTVFSRSSFL